MARRRGLHAHAREGFLLTPPRLAWRGEQHYIDDVPVSERVWLLAYGNDLAAARAAWLEDCEAAAAAGATI